MAEVESKREAQSSGPDKPEPDSVRILRMERRLNAVLVLAAVQTVLLSVLLVMFLIPKFFYILQFVLILGAVIGFLFLFRNEIPKWLGRASRYLFSLFAGVEKKT